MSTSPETCMLVRRETYGDRKYMVAFDLTRHEAMTTLHDLLGLGRNPQGQDYEILSYVPAEMMRVLADQRIRP